MKLRDPGGLWLHRDFRSLWTAETISDFGTQITQLAIPLVAVITLHASAFEVAPARRVEFLRLPPDQPARRRLGRPDAPRSRS